MCREPPLAGTDFIRCRARYTGRRVRTRPARRLSWPIIAPPGMSSCRTIANAIAAAKNRAADEILTPVDGVSDLRPTPAGDRSAVHHRNLFSPARHLAGIRRSCRRPNCWAARQHHGGNREGGRAFLDTGKARPRQRNITPTALGPPIAKDRPAEFGWLRL